jgi:hypothetical protein
MKNAAKKTLKGAATKNNMYVGGGLKGFLTKAGKSFYSGGLWAKDWVFWTAQKSGRVGFVLATTSVRIVTSELPQIVMMMIMQNRNHSIYHVFSYFYNSQLFFFVLLFKKIAPP